MVRSRAFAGLEPALKASHFGFGLGAPEIIERAGRLFRGAKLSAQVAELSAEVTELALVGGGKVLLAAEHSEVATRELQAFGGKLAGGAAELADHFVPTLTPALSATFPIRMAPPGRSRLDPHVDVRF